MRALILPFILLVSLSALSQAHWSKERIPATNGVYPTYNNIAIDGSTVWMSTDDEHGILQWENGTATWYTTANSGLTSNEVRDIAYHDNKLWAITGTGLFSFDGTSFQPESGSGDELFVDENDNLWMTHNTEILSYSNGAFSSFYNHTDSIFHFTVDQSGTPWFTTFFVIDAQHPLYNYDGSTLQSLFANDIDPNIEGYFLTDMASRNGKVSLSSSNGFFTRDGTWSWTGENSGLHFQAVRHIDIDASGQVWASVVESPTQAYSQTLYRELNQLEVFSFQLDGTSFEDLVAANNIIYGCGRMGSLYRAETGIEDFDDMATMDVNNVKAQFYAHGSHANLGPEINWSNFEINPGDSTTGMFGWAPMIGVKVGNDLHASGGLYDNDFEAGPLSESKAVYRAPILKISQQDIDDHLANFSSQGYTVPDNILHYPGNGQVAFGEPLEMAPFVDANSNGYYDPINGDYPVIRGDLSIFHTFHDEKLIPTLTAGLPAGIEVQCLIYAYDEPANPALDNSIFFRYTLINRSGVDFDSLGLGLFTDFDLGNAQDDYVGSNPAKNTWYAYNGDSFDEDAGGQIGFGSNPPAIGIKMLSDPLQSFRKWSNTGGPTSQPTVDADIWNYLNSRWRDETPLTYGGNGYDPMNPNATLTDHALDGNPVAGTGWTEMTAGNVVGDRRGFGTFPITSLADGERISYDLVWSASQQGGDNLSNITSLFDDQDDVADFFANQTFEEGELASTRAPFTVGIDEATSTSVRVFPNPSQGQIFVQANEAIQEVQLSDAHGRVISTEVQLSGSRSELSFAPSLENGLYFLTVKTEQGTTATQKVFLLR